MNSEQFLKHEINRRQFLGSSAKNAAGMAAGMVGLSGAASTATGMSPGDCVSIGVIGIRNQGAALAEAFAKLPDVHIAAVCDIDPSLFPKALRSLEEMQLHPPRCETDYHRVLDDRGINAVVIAVPDHWHAEMCVQACRAGKDVYLEAPVSHSLGEGRQLREAAAQTGRVIQTGLQQRSGAHFQSAVTLVRGGSLGRVRLAKAWTVHRRKSIGHKADQPAPEGVDYRRWLGPAPARPFNPNRFHHNWQSFWDYGSGALGQWGVHMLDVARWGLGVDLPQRIAATGGTFHFHDDQQTPDTLLVNYSYPRETIVWEHRLWSNRGVEGRSTGVAFYGERGTLVVDRGGWKVYDQRDAPSSDSSPILEPHVRNFIDCVKTRSQPVADLDLGLTSSALCHLGNLAYRRGREIHFDDSTQHVVDDPGLNDLA